MIILRLALSSLRNRWVTATLTVLAIAISVLLLLGVEKVRTGARASFANTISGTDLVVGSRSGDVQLLLYAVFRIGNATNNITWESYQDIANRPEIDWIVPISLGDSHRQFRVMGTTPAFFERYRYRGGRDLAFASGDGLDDLYDAVVGADVAAALGYATGDPIVVSHGLASFTAHDDQTTAERILYGVVQEIPQYLGNPLRIDLYNRKIRREIQHELMVFTAPRHVLYNGLSQARQSDGLKLHA